MPYLMKKGFLYDMEDSFDILMDYSVIFIGEEHESRISHDAELTILKGLAERDSNLVLALEMFERDVQDILDAYLKGKISEKKFLKQSRPWPNYPKDYRPLIEFAKKKGMPVIAANIPRRAAAAVSMANKISPDVMGEDRIYLPKTVHLKSKEYYKRFASSMEGMPHFTPMKGMKVDGLYKAQVSKGCCDGSLRRTFPRSSYPLLLWTFSFRLPPRHSLSTPEESSKTQNRSHRHGFIGGEPSHERPFKGSRFYLG